MRWVRTKAGILVPASSLKRKFRSNAGKQFTDKTTLQGMLEIWRKPKASPNGRGEKIWSGPWEPLRPKLVNSGPNLVVDNGRESAALLLGLGGAGASLNRHIGFMAIGRGSGGGATTPLPTNNALILETLRKSTSNDFPTTSSVRATMVVLDVESNTPPDDDIDEAGLFSADNTTMVAHRTFPTLTKTAAFSFEFRWRINT